MPAYKTAQSVAAAAQTALSQDYDNLVVGICAPTSDIATLEAAGAVGDRRVQVLEQTGKGIADARNKIMREIVADLYVFLDSDDYLNPGMISAYVRHRLETGEAGLRYGHYTRQLAGTGSPREMFRAPFLGRVRNPFTRLVVLNFIGPGSAMVDREILDQVGYFDTRFNHAEDWHFWLRVVRKFPLFGLDFVAYHYTYGKLMMEVPFRRVFFDDGARVLNDVCDSWALRQLSLTCIRAMAALYYVRTFHKRRSWSQIWDFRILDFVSLPFAAVIYYLRRKLCAI